MPVYQKKDKNGKVIKDTKGNSWYYRCYYTDMYGNRKQRESKLYCTKSQAQEEERIFLSSIVKSGIDEENADFCAVCSNWLEYKREKVKSTSFYGITKLVGKHILPFFTKYKINYIKIEDINSWKKILIKKNMSISKTNEIITYFKEILNYAVIYNKFDVRIASYLSKIRDDSPQDKEKDSQINFWTIGEYAKFISNVDDYYYNLIFNFLYRTGLRLGEFRALNWNDIDLKKKKISITKSISHDTFEKGSIIVSPKTKNSIRTVDIDDNLLILLQEYYQSQLSYYNFNKNWFAFGGIKPIAITTLRRKLNYYIDISNVKKITIHGFRHSHVSMLIHIGCDVKDVAERIGDTIMMVEKTYYHMFPEKKKITLEKLNNLKI